MNNVLELNKLKVEFPLSNGAVLHAVRDVSFDIKSNEILAVVGESGCGKSMTALAVMDLLHRKARRKIDRLSFMGKDISKFSKKEMNKLRGDRMAMIFQEPMTSLNPVYTIGNQLEEVYLRHRTVGRDEATKRAIELLDKVGVPAPDQRMKQYPHQLSGGLRQRVMIAMALMCKPDLIIADEPTTALDVTIQAQVLKLLKDLQQELGTAIMIITHDLGVVARMADRVLVMYAGEIVESGTARDIFEQPTHPYTQGLIRCLPSSGTTPDDAQKLGTIPGVVPSLIGEFTGCGFENRCIHAMDSCKQQSVNLTPLTETHNYRCLLDSAQAQNNFLGKKS